MISGNATAIELAAGATRTAVQGNIIGLDGTGMIALGNSGGVVMSGGATNNIIGGTTPAARNVITSNVDGVIVGATTIGNQVLGNYIGLNTAGAAVVGTGTWGVFIDQGAANNTIGGTVAGAGNVIAGQTQGAIALAKRSNRQPGVGERNRAGRVRYQHPRQRERHRDSAGCSVQHDRRTGRLRGKCHQRQHPERRQHPGREYRMLSSRTQSSTTADSESIPGADGVTQNDTNDTDSGPNNLQNFPVITAATTSSVSGTLHSTPNTSFIVHIFVNNTCDASGFGEGQQHLDTRSVTTDAAGNADISAGSSGLTLTAGQFVTATATDTAGNTSEFSACFQVTAQSQAVVSVVATDATADEAGPDGGSFTFTRTGPTTSPLNVTFTLTGTATPGVDYVNTIGTLVTIPSGQTSSTVNFTPILDALVEPNETVIVTLTTGTYDIGTPNTATATITENTPTVTVVASDATASEAGLDSGAFTFTRTGPTVAPLNIQFTLGGTATVGVDYPNTIGTLVTIPSGQSSAIVTFTPSPDALVEGPETVTVTIAAGTYVIGALNTASATIIDTTPAAALSFSVQPTNTAVDDPSHLR